MYLIVFCFVFLYCDILWNQVFKNAIKTYILMLVKSSLKFTLLQIKSRCWITMAVWIMELKQVPHYYYFLIIFCLEDATHCRSWTDVASKHCPCSVLIRMINLLLVTSQKKEGKSCYFLKSWASSCGAH